MSVNHLARLGVIFDIIGLEETIRLFQLYNLTPDSYCIVKMQFGNDKDFLLFMDYPTDWKVVDETVPEFDKIIEEILYVKYSKRIQKLLIAELLRFCSNFLKLHPGNKNIYPLASYHQLMVNEPSEENFKAICDQIAIFKEQLK